MTINFDNIQLEGDAAAALDALKSNEAFTKYLAESVSNREEAVRQSAAAEFEPLKKKVDEFRNNNLTLQQQLEKFKGFDADEYKRLKSLGSDANAAAEQIKRIELEYKGQLEGKDGKVQELSQQLEQLNQARVDDAFRFDAQAAIQRHNMKNKAVSVEDGAEALLIEKMMQSRKMIDSKIVMLDNGREFTTDAGIGSIDDWVNVVARREYPFLFKKPVGGGAPGSSGGAGSKQMTRSEFDAISDPARRSEIARTYTITD